MGEVFLIIFNLMGKDYNYHWDETHVLEFNIIGEDYSFRWDETLVYKSLMRLYLI